MDRNTGAGMDDGVASHRWKAVAAALADTRRLDLYARIISAANSGAPLHNGGLDRAEAKSLAALEKAGLVAAGEDGALRADSGVFRKLLAGDRHPVDSSPLRLMAPGRAGGLPGKRTDRLELLHHLAGEVFSRHGALTGEGGAGAGGPAESGPASTAAVDGVPSEAGSAGTGPSEADPGNGGAGAPAHIDPAASAAQLTEAEVTARLAEYSDDPALVRRAMVDEGIVRRSPDGSRYWLARPRPASGMEFV